jgi:hypothetical protein
MVYLFTPYRPEPNDVTEALVEVLAGRPKVLRQQRLRTVARCRALLGLCGRSHVEDIKFGGLVRVESTGEPTAAVSETGQRLDAVLGWHLKLGGDMLILDWDELNVREPGAKSWV